jgi:hypothetical protein
MEASSHVLLYSVVQSTQRVYGVRLCFVSARTNKRHHHHQRVEDEHERAGGGEGKRFVSDLISNWELKKKRVSFGVLLMSACMRCRIHDPRRPLCWKCRARSVIPWSLYCRCVRTTSRYFTTVDPLACLLLSRRQKRRLLVWHSAWRTLWERSRTRRSAMLVPRAVWSCRGLTFLRFTGCHS